MPKSKSQPRQKSVGALLRALRLAVGLTPAERESRIAEALRQPLTHRELALRARIHRPNITAIESGSRVPGKKVAARLAEAFGVHPSTFLSKRGPRGRAK